MRVKTTYKNNIAIKTTPELSKSEVLMGKSLTKVKESVSNGNELTTNKLDNNLPQRINKTKEYKTFIKLIKKDKFTTAMYTAKLLGVTRQTIATWLRTPSVIKAMNSTIEEYIEDIEQSKDWKAKAYLMDKLEGNKEEQNSKQELKQLIVINT